jgi:Predicted nucleoside-diphosphate sugar epimerases
VGIQPGEKIHEQMISIEDSPYTYEYKNYYKILPSIHNWSKDPYRIGKGKKVSNNFLYTSNNNKDWMTREQLKNWIERNHFDF